MVNVHTCYSRFSKYKDYQVKSNSCCLKGNEEKYFFMILPNNNNNATEASKGQRETL